MSTVTEIASSITERIRALESEQAQLLKARAALLDGDQRHASPGSGRRRARRRQAAVAASGAAPAAPAHKRTRKRAASGSNSAAVLKALADASGEMRAPELASAAGIHATAIYRVAGRLVETGAVTRQQRDGKTVFALASASPGK